LCLQPSCLAMRESALDELFDLRQMAVSWATCCLAADSGDSPAYERSDIEKSRAVVATDERQR
jgi:hypothetical protein